MKQNLKTEKHNVLQSFVFRDANNYVPQQHVGPLGDSICGVTSHSQTK